MPVDFTPEESAKIDFEPIDFQPIEEKPKGFWEQHPILSRFAFGPSEEDLGGVKLLGAPDDSSLLPKAEHSDDEGWPSYLAKGAYNFLIRPLGTPEGLIGAATPEIPIAKGPMPSAETITKSIGKPASKAARLALPPGRGETFVAGPAGNPLGQVAKGGIEVPPDVAAKISGEAIPVRTNEPAPHSVDLGEVREQERLKRIFFTDFEHQGGVPLNLPDKPSISSPPVSGDTGLGFSAQSNANLDYPLNVVPNAVRPRSVQEVTRSLAGDDFSKPVTPKKGVVFENELGSPRDVSPEGRPDYYTGKGAIEPGELILPSAREIQSAAKNAGVMPEPLAAAVSHAPPPVAKAAADVVREESARPSMWKSIYSELKGQSEDLYAKSFRAVHIERQYKASWVPQLQSAVNKLTKVQKENFGGYVEGSIPITDPIVQQAVDIWKQVEGAIGDEAENIGLRLRIGETGKSWIPFQKNPNYWPHMMAEKLSDNSMLERLMKNGMTRFEANKVVAHARRTGEIVVSPQHAREGNKVFPYRLDADAGLAHIRTMARRIAQHREFGPLDLKGKGVEGISDLVEATANPQKTVKLMQRIIGRDEQNDAQLMKVLNAARKYSTITKLQTFTLPNVILGQSSTALRASRYQGEILGELSSLLKRSYRDELRASGVWQDFAHSLMEEVKPGVDWYGIGAGETINRAIAGSVGRGVARGAFKTLKSNPADKRAARELFELLGEKANNLLKQDNLTDDQLRMASGRMAERTQGLNVPGNLPHSWSSPVQTEKDLAWQSFLIFKKMGYQATKNLWESVKADPVRVIPAWLMAAQLGGELVGDSKSVLRGIFQGDPQAAVEDRGSYWLESAGIPQSAIEGVASTAGIDPLIVARLFDNYMQSFFLGLPADMLMSSQFGPEGLIKSVAGPVAGDISSTANKVMKGDIRGLGKDALSALPIPGSRGLAEFLTGD